MFFVYVRNNVIITCKLFCETASMPKDLFIDRKNELVRITTGLKGGKDYVLIAPRRYGKTTLVQKILNDISTDPDYIVINIDIMRYSGSIQSIAEGIIESCLHALGLIGKLKLLIKQMDFSLRVKMSLGDLEFEPILKLLKTPIDQEGLLIQALELLENIAITRSKTVIVFFDEFGELVSHGEQVIKIFRSVIQLHKHVNYIFAGSQETLMREIFIEKTSAFYRFGDLIFLDNFEKLEVIEHLNNMGLEYSVIEGILSYFDCHPYYTSKTIKDMMIYPEYGQSFSNFLDYINEYLINQEIAYLEVQLQKIKERVHALDLISLLAMEVDPYSYAGITRQGVYSILKSLEKVGFIKNIDKGKYKISDPLLKLYLSQ